VFAGHVLALLVHIPVHHEVYDLAAQAYIVDEGSPFRGGSVGRYPAALSMCLSPSFMFVTFMAKSL